jgi:hypothetical protein
MAEPWTSPFPRLEGDREYMVWFPVREVEKI